MGVLINGTSRLPLGREGLTEACWEEGSAGLHLPVPHVQSVWALQLLLGTLRPGALVRETQTKPSRSEALLAESSPGLMGNMGSHPLSKAHLPPTPSWAPPPPFDLLLLHFQLLHHLLKLLLLGFQHLVQAFKLLRRTRGEEKSHAQRRTSEVGTAALIQEPPGMQSRPGSMGADSGVSPKEAWSHSVTPNLNKPKVCVGFGLIRHTEHAAAFRKAGKVVSLGLEVEIIPDIYSARQLQSLTPSGVLAGSQVPEEKGMSVYSHQRSLECHL